MWRINDPRPKTDVEASKQTEWTDRITEKRQNGTEKLGDMVLGAVNKEILVGGFFSIPKKEGVEAINLEGGGRGEVI